MAALASALVATATWLTGCGKPTRSPTPAPPPTASWIHWPPLELRSTGATLTPSRYGWVAPAVAARAAKRLEAQRSVELSDADALALGADAIAPPNTSDGRWYLLRGAEIRDAPPRGDVLTVRVGPGFVAVATSGNRPHPGPGSANRAVLARLDEPPGEVYTYVEVAYTGGLPDLHR